MGKKIKCSKFFLFAAACFAVVAALPLSAAESVKMATWNINYCNNNGIGSAAVAKAVAAIDPDYIALNEVSISGSYDSGQNQAEIIAAASGLVVAGYTNVKYGNALLSKVAPISAETIMLPMSTEGWGTRYCTICEFTNYCVAVTHLDTVRSGCDDALVQASNAVAIATMRERFSHCSKPVFLCGDWNTRPNWDNMALFNEFLEILSPTNGIRTYHGSGGTSSLILDYIAVTKDDAANFIVTNAYVVEDRTTSDHAPVVIEFYRMCSADEIDDWVNESALTSGLTGSWNTNVTYDASTLKADMDGSYIFTATNLSAGTPVSITLTAEMSAASEDWAFDAGDDAQAAIRLGTNGVFQVWTSSGWLDTTTPGINGHEYTLQTVFDYVKNTYSAFVYGSDSGVWTQMEAAGGMNAFALANPGKGLDKVELAGKTVFTSLLGAYVQITGFTADDALSLRNGITTNLTWALATWLNACTNGTDDVTAAAAGMSATEFFDAYLLNLDISKGTGYSFEITGIEKDSTSVSLAVTLIRDGKVDQAVNGTLKFYTSADLKAYTEAGEAILSDDDFSDGDTATATIEISDGTAKFYKAVIE